MYICKRFGIQELVPPHIFEARGYKAWELFDSRLLWTLDQIRERYGVTIVNDWAWGGVREWSGLRTPDSPYYSRFSQHSFANAFDCLFKSVTPEEVREDILKCKHDPIFKFITAIEKDVGWLHFDGRNCKRILQFNNNAINLNR